ncbi:MAG: hypothetical protein M1816_001442 [Peltula sp. TS41687]|nr:MAG: hypothetical protein M1816_001442 [Peltula sp. TS41687]
MSVRSILKHPRNVESVLQVPRRNRNVSQQHSTVSVRALVTPLSSILIANRGEIALRVGRTASESGIRTTTVYTEPDALSQHALSSPFAVRLGDPTAYLNGDRIIEVAKREGCQGIHPGYGFLSENSTFAKKCTEAGIIFIGPPWRAIEAMGSKRVVNVERSESKDIMTAAGMPCIPGYHGANQDPDHLLAEAAKIGFPVMLKAIKGGGGRGMRIVRRPAEFHEQLTSAKSEALNSFGDDRMLVEKYISTPRHIEVQVFADKHGNCVALGERDCSIQRRHQKILEESPAPFLAPDVRQDIWSKARAAALAVGYEGAGTVEFIFDNDTGEFFFMEMNTRLQVEHPVTEMVTGEDLVRWQFLVAEGKELPLSQEEIEARIAERGWAIEARIYAENPDMNFIPDSGRLLHLKTPKATDTVRIDAGFVQGDEVSTYYDPMIAKLIVRGPDRKVALQKLKAALEEYEIVGPKTNIEFLKRICGNAKFIAGDVETGFIDKHREELFARRPTADEVYAQAALGVLLQEAMSHNGNKPQRLLFGDGGGAAVGFGVNAQREMSFIEKPTGGSTVPSSPAVFIRVRPTDRPNTFDVEIERRRGAAEGGAEGGATPTDTSSRQYYANVISQFDPSTNKLMTFYPHTRIESTIIHDSVISHRHLPYHQQPQPSIHLFQLGEHHILQSATPSWLDKVRGQQDDRRSSSGSMSSNGVLAPMAGKVVEVKIARGHEVKKDDTLVVIESMKTQMVIRAPQDGKIARVVYRQGDRCEAGTPLVEFE